MSKGIKTTIKIPQSEGYPCLAWHNVRETNQPLPDDDIFLLTSDEDTEETVCTNLTKGGAYVTTREEEYTKLPVGTSFTITQS